MRQTVHSVLLAGGAALALCQMAGAQGTSAPPAGDGPRVSYARLFCTADGETRFEDAVVSFRRIGAPPMPPMYFGDPMTVTRAIFAAFEAHWGAHDMETRKWHPAPYAQTIVMLRGTFTIATTSGEVRRFGPGDAIRVEDTAPCRGHITVAGDEPVSVLITR